MVGMILLVMCSSSFLPFRVGGQVGSWRVWVRRLMALRSPAVAMRYLPLTAILETSCLRVLIWVGVPSSAWVVIRVSAVIRQ